MKKKITRLLFTALSISMIILNGCGSEQQNTQAETTGSKPLIIYFAVAENSEVDAVSSASVVADGRGMIKVIADDIQAVTGGDMFSIETSVAYPGGINQLIEYAAEEQNNDERPEIISHIENLEDYDTIFIGYPIWWYDIPQIMYSFFDEYDFSGKTIIPFVTHNGSRLIGTPDTIQELEPDATVITDGFSVNQRDVEDAAGDVEEWLKDLGYPQ